MANKEQKDIVEIRFHGRGGQGAKTAAVMLAEAAMSDGKYIQSFPEYGPERGGAPVYAFVRISTKPINLHCHIKNPDIVVVIDPTLLNKSVVEDVASKSVLVVNTPEQPADIKRMLGFNGRVYTVDATAISLNVLGANFPNTPMLGAVVAATNVVNIEKLADKLREKFLEKIGREKTEKNIECVKRAFREVKSA